MAVLVIAENGAAVTVLPESGQSVGLGDGNGVRGVDGGPFIDVYEEKVRSACLFRFMTVLLPLIIFRGIKLFCCDVVFPFRPC